jgi:RNA polymerase sigma-70 factor (ECF subfamily)
MPGAALTSSSAAAGEHELVGQQDRVGEFIQLFTSHEPRLRAYVLTLVARWSDAEEVMQQCNLVLWQKFGAFQGGTNFFAWACQIARLEVLDFRKRRGRERALFSDAFVESIAAEASGMADELSDRQAALQHCMEKLSDEHRNLLHRRYADAATIEHLARAMGRSADAVYKTLSRVRQMLHDCISRTMALGKA